MKRTHVIHFNYVKSFVCSLLIAITFSFFVSDTVSVKSKTEANWKVRSGTERASGQAIEGVI